MVISKLQRVALQSVLLLSLALGSAPLSATYWPESDDEENVVKTPSKQTSPKEETQPGSISRWINWLTSPFRAQPQQQSGENERAVTNDNEVTPPKKEAIKKNPSRRLSFSKQESGDNEDEQGPLTTVTTPTKEKEKKAEAAPHTPLMGRVEDVGNNEVGAPSTPVSSIYPTLPESSPQNTGQGDVVEEHKTPSSSKKQKSDEESEEERQKKKIQADKEVLLKEKEEDLGMEIGGIPLFTGVSYDYQIAPEKPVRNFKSGAAVRAAYRKCSEKNKKTFKIVKAERLGQKLFGL
jgi:hypothetical protein